jgi:hypothetical protein
MTAWAVATQTRNDLGYFQVVISAPNAGTKDVTFFRDVPVSVDSWSSADPFGDSTAQITFNSISVLDDIGQGDLNWLRDFADVDIYLVHPDTTKTKVWEGFIASHEYNSSEDTTSLTVQCQGALFQLDKYLESPSYPTRPIPNEIMMARAMDPARRENLRTKPLIVKFPTGWSVVAPADATTDGYTKFVGVSAGELITGYGSRNTGAWDRTLTSFIQNLLQSMLTNDVGDQWTIRMNKGRQPVLLVRKSNPATTTYSCWAAQPGVTLTLTRDYTQYTNVIYGSGTDVSGRAWKRQQISPDGSQTSYEPLAALPSVEPAHITNPNFDNSIMRAESYTQFDAGMAEDQAVSSAGVSIRRFADPGYAGTITLAADLPEGSRYLMSAGETITVKGLVGTGNTGVKFHIAEVSVSPADGTVQLKVDSKFRDLTSLDEAINRNRDALTPVKLLNINRQSILIPDAEAPWDYNAGSGYVPRTSLQFYKGISTDPGDPNTTQGFPYLTQSLKYPALRYGQFYIECMANGGGKAGHQSREARWSFARVLMSAKGTIRRTEFSLHDEFGNIVKAPFHVSVYSTTVTANDMPYDAGGPSPFLKDAKTGQKSFDSTDQFGNPISSGIGNLLPQASLIIGWGDVDQPAGYSPGLKSNGDAITGLLIDDQTWTYDLTQYSPYVKALNPGQSETADSISVTVAMYCEYTRPVFFRGRFYNQPTGIS